MKNKKTLSLFALGMFALLGISLVAAYQGDFSTNGPHYSEERYDAMQTAFEELDYDAWVSLMSEEGRNPRVLSVITEDNFEQFVEAHNAAEAGDYETAKEIRAELGLGNGSKFGNGSGLGQGNRMRHGSMNGQGMMRGQGNCYLD